MIRRLWPLTLTPFRASGPQPRPSRPRVVSGVRVYAVGDIHGRADRLDHVHEAIDRHRASASATLCVEVYLGDYVDRGADSRGVIERLRRRGTARPGVQVVTLRGNHEVMMLRAFDDPQSLSGWVRNGGLETLMSYGVGLPARPDVGQLQAIVGELRMAVPDEHLRFLRTLGTSFRCGDYFFVHAGVRPGVSLERQSEQDLLWIRDDFTGSDADFGAVVVHGHTPVRQAEFRPNRINIDTGAYITGNLTCLVLEGEDASILD
jgi:serine/threonine protein phosphatase 1